MLNYNYDPITFEYICATDARIDPLESKVQGKDVYLCPSNATHTEPPLVDVVDKATIYDPKKDSWHMEQDHRGTIVYDADTGDVMKITKIGIVLDDFIIEGPVDMVKPKYIDGEWVEQAIIYNGVTVESKADVDAQTVKRIFDLGEEKAKTEKLIAGADACEIWDVFLAARAVVLAEGEDCISTNNLS